MADFVTTNPVPQVSAPQSRVSPAEVAQPYQELAGLMVKGAEGLEKSVAEPLAKQAGLKAVTRDPNTGELVMSPQPLIVGDAAVEFHKAVKVSALAQGEAEAKRQDLAMSKQFHNDPEGYLKAADAFRKEHVADYEKKFGPDVGIALGRSIDNATTYNYRWLLLEQQRMVKHNFDVATRSKIVDLDNDITTLISSGTPFEDKTLQAKINERLHLTMERANSPLGVSSPDLAKIDLKQFDQSVGAARHVATVNDIIKNKGVEAATRFVEAGAADTKTEPVQRALNYAQGLKAIQDHMATLQKQIHLNQTFQKISDDDYANLVIKDSASGNPTITEHDIKTQPGLSSAERMRLLNWKKRDDMPEPMARTSELATQDALRRMQLPADNPDAITGLAQIRDLYANKGVLRRTDYDWLEKRFIEGRSPEGQQLSKMREQVIKSSGLDKSSMMSIDGEGRMRQYKYEWYVDQRVAQYRAEKKNPMDLFDPTKPDFIGKPEIVDFFSASMADQAKEKVRRMRERPGSAPPGYDSGSATPAAVPLSDDLRRRPGESIEDYNARIGPPKTIR
jgi:hypothetical protein